FRPACRATSSAKCGKSLRNSGSHIDREVLVERTRRYGTHGTANSFTRSIDRQVIVTGSPQAFDPRRPRGRMRIGNRRPEPNIAGAMPAGITAAPQGDVVRK